MSTRGEALEAAIQQVLHEHSDEPAEQGLITGWVLVVESVGSDAVPAVRLYASPSTPWWRDYGLLTYAVSVCKASMFTRRSS